MRLAITLGDPAGIGTEVVLAALRTFDAAPLLVCGDWELTRQTAAQLDLPFSFVRIFSLDEITNEPRLFLDIGERDSGPLRFGLVDARYGRIALRSIEAAVAAIQSAACDALITAPLHKEAILAAGAEFPGHTELLASRAGLHEYGRDFAMYFDSPSLRVALLSVHVPLTEAIRLVTAERIVALAALIDREYPRLYDRRPRIAVAGLNPHAGEGGHFGSEESTIAAAVVEARERGIAISGPHAADMLFRNAMRGECDVVLSLFHDQGLIAVKTVAFETSVNVTLGLPYLRASVDHGTAFDIAGRGIADFAPMRYAIDWALAHAEGYRR